MKFAEIIKAAGICPKFYPKSSEIPVTVFSDGDDVSEESLSFREKLFESNNVSHTRFSFFLRKLECTDEITLRQVSITPENVIISYNAGKVKVLPRQLQS